MWPSSLRQLLDGNKLKHFDWDSKIGSAYVIILIKVNCWSAWFFGFILQLLTFLNPQEVWKVDEETLIAWRVYTMDARRNDPVCLSLRNSFGYASRTINNNQSSRDKSMYQLLRLLVSVRIGSYPIRFGSLQRTLPRCEWSSLEPITLSIPACKTHQLTSNT